MKPLRFDAAAVELIREETGLTYEQIAREIGCTLGCILRWKRRGLSADALVALLRFCAGRRLRAARTLEGQLEQACENLVWVRCRSRRNPRRKPK